MPFLSTQPSWGKIKLMTFSMKQPVLPLKSSNVKCMFSERRIKIRLSAKFSNVLRKTKHS